MGMVVVVMKVKKKKKLGRKVVKKHSMLLYRCIVLSLGPYVSDEREKKKHGSTSRGT